MIIRTVILLLFFNVYWYAQEHTPLTKIGEIKPRHAKEIEASPWSVGAETMDREYTIYANWNQHLGPLGVKKARIQSGWRKTEPRKGTYDFTWLDTIIYNMHDQKVKPWMNLSFGNPLYTEFKGDPVRGDIPKTAEAKRAWNAFVKQLVVRYQHIINEWEIWNEPAYYKNITPEEYVELVIATGDAIRSIQPNASLYLFAYGHGQLKKQLSEECIEPDDPCNYAKKIMDIL
jgi:beta-glucosidase/6-phospho-beta-glucosidase/beta-galactosidase